MWGHLRQFITQSQSWLGDKGQPRDLLLQNNLFIHPYPVLKSSGCAKLTNCSTKAIPQNSTDLFLLSHSAQLGASPEGKAKGILLHQLLRVFQRPKSKKEFFPISTTRQLHDSQSIIAGNSSDPLDLDRSQRPPWITWGELGGKGVHFFVHHFLV